MSVMGVWMTDRIDRCIIGVSLTPVEIPNAKS